MRFESWTLPVLRANADARVHATDVSPHATGLRNTHRHHDSRRARQDNLLSHVLGREYMRHVFLRRPPAQVRWPNTHTLQPVTQGHLDGLPTTRVWLLLEEARGESVQMSRARETEEVPLSVVHLRLKERVARPIVAQRAARAPK